jgi:hypothetical protein
VAESKEPTLGGVYLQILVKAGKFCKDIHSSLFFISDAKKLTVGLKVETNKS